MKNLAHPVNPVLEKRSEVSPSVQTLAGKRGRDSIRELFSSIAHRYDFLNHFLSLNFDRWWRKRATELSEISPSAHVLDLCAGTGDLAFAFLKRLNADGRATAVDFSRPMLELAQAKAEKRGERRLVLLESDALCLPFPDNSFDCVTVAFGVRNFVDLEAGLKEMHRVTRPGGRAIILEFAPPESALLRMCFVPYLKFILPWIGRILSNFRADAYTYLRDSIEQFPTPQEISAAMERADWQDVQPFPLTFGMVVCYRAEKTELPSRTEGTTDEHR